tara:strand:- start:68 stop:607 length:540 start_codon:yes stop_codon:yes gene_type:complete
VSKVTFPDGTQQSTSAAPFAPYYVGVALSANQDMTDNDTQQLIDLETYLPSPYNSFNSDFNNSTRKWTCPQTGLYLCSLRVLAAMAGDDIRQSEIWIISNPGTGSEDDDYRESGSKYTNNYYDDVINLSMYTQSLIPMTIGHTLRGEARIIGSGGSGREFIKDATFGGRATELIITRII